MTPEEYAKLETSLRQAVAEQVKLTVNGKVDKMMISHGQMHDQFIKHVADDAATDKILTDFIAKAEPLLDMMKNLSWGWKAVLAVLGGAAGLMTVIAIIVELFKKK